MVPFAAQLQCFYVCSLFFFSFNGCLYYAFLNSKLVSDLFKDVHMTLSMNADIVYYRAMVGTINTNICDILKFAFSNIYTCVHFVPFLYGNISCPESSPLEFYFSFF